MSNITYKNAGKQAFMGLVRELVSAYQAFSSYDAAGLRRFDLTQAQADVIFTLGNTEGLTFKEIGDKTLITKGTLTGVIDRLEAKDMVKRVVGMDDRRCTRVVLTGKGVKLFQASFPEQIKYLKERFDRLSGKDINELDKMLKRLKAIF